jgi:hypothetical protein
MIPLVPLNSVKVSGQKLKKFRQELNKQKLHDQIRALKWT